eukprot:gene8978-10598_t
MYGGTDFSPSDVSTFWTSASHFYTWWKNNIERKTKFLSLLKDSIYNGDDEKNTTRSKYCKQAIALAINIKNHFERVLNQQVDRNMLIQIDLPFPMPAHLTALQVNVSRCTFCYSDLDATSKSEECSLEMDHCVVCANCVSPITYDDYTLSVMDTAHSKLASKKRTSTARTSTKKRSRVEDDEFVTSREKRGKYCHSRGDSAARTAMNCMHQAVGLQHARRALRSCKEAALDDLSAAFDFDETGSALLLELKENSKVVEGQGSVCSHGSSDLPVEHCAAPPQHQASVWEPLRIITSPYEKASTPELASGPNTHDFLLACYRDGIYPSPDMSSAAASSAGVAGLFGRTFFTHNPLHQETMASHSAGTEVDAGDEAATDLAVPGTHSLSCSAADMSSNNAALERKSSPNCSSSPSRHTQNDTYQTAASPLAHGAEPPEGLLLTLAPLSPTPQQQQQQQQQQRSPALPSFGYDELQQLLTHLLCDARD